MQGYTFIFLLTSHVLHYVHYINLLVKIKHVEILLLDTTYVARDMGLMLHDTIYVDIQLMLQTGHDFYLHHNMFTTSIY